MARGKYHDWVTEDGLKSIESWARDGLTDKQIAKNIGVAEATFTRWKKRYPSIMSALKKGKRPVDFEVENALLKNALGFEYEETYTEYQEDDDGNVKKVVKKYKKKQRPDTSAIIFWLKNRKPELWRNMTPEFRAKVEAETENLKVDSEIKKKELEEIERNLSADDEKVLFVDSREEMQKWIEENGG